MHRVFAIGAVAAVLAAALCGSAGAWSWPADGEVLRPFTLGADAYAAGQHRGIDVAGPDGSPVLAPASGAVTFAGSLPTYGRGVTILTEDGYSVTLVHLGTIGVSEGEPVSEGASVGTMGSSGTPEQSVPSVHLGIRHAADEHGYVDPLGLLPERPAAPAPGTEPAPAPEPVTPAAPVAATPPPSASTPTPTSPPATGPVTSGQPVVAAPASPTPGSAQTTRVSPTPAATPAQPAETPVTAPHEPGVVVGGRAAPAPAGEATPADAGAGRGVETPADAPVFRVDAGAEAPSARSPGSMLPKMATANLSAATRGAHVAPPSRPPHEQPTEIRATPTAGGGPSTDALSPRASSGAARAAAGDRVADVVSAAQEEPNDSRRPLRPQYMVHPRSPGPSAALPPVTERALGGGTSVVHASLAPRDGAAREAATGVGPAPRGLVGLWRIVLVGALALVLAAMVARRVARRIGGNGALLPDHADLLRELDPAHRACVHDRGGRRLRASSAAART
ncbi:MAG TPA: peptidoglycan DD-metalloendopeptidase family protein [Gaiella sp.]|nr:peptidoglycan DD-metalloendopeptidase family protein [Gaiella sp.]